MKKKLMWGLLSILITSGFVYFYAWHQSTVGKLQVKIAYLERDNRAKTAIIDVITEEYHKLNNDFNKLLTAAIAKSSDRETPSGDSSAMQTEMIMQQENMARKLDDIDHKLRFGF
jgi:hypothetical protein